MTWVYIKSEAALWTVGFYAPDGTWHTDSDHLTREDAAKRCAWLNGAQRVVVEVSERNTPDYSGLDG